MPDSLYIGDFDSEKYWRDEDLIKLPAMKSSDSELIILGMDELLFPFCCDNDVLITRIPFNKVLKNYLGSIGFIFNSSDEIYHTDMNDENKSIFEIIFNDKAKFNQFLNSVSNCMEFSPYSVISFTNELYKKFNFINKIPDFESVRKINSKLYSYKLNKEFGFDHYSKTIYSGNELLEEGKIFLKKGAFVIKDIYGVSGKGNLMINSQSILERIVRFIKSCENKGRKCIFLVEEYLDREFDFSCCFVISENGIFIFETVQIMINKQFSYIGSETANEKFICFLEEKKYFEFIKKVCGNLYEEGYFGEVCIDSMVLKTGDIIPLVEINGRKSMGFINNEINRKLSKFGVNSTFNSVNIGFVKNLTFEDILTALNDENILFSGLRDYGIMPVSSNTIFANNFFNIGGANKKVIKGRFYYSLISNCHFNREAILQKLKYVLEKLNFRLYASVK